MAMAAQTPKARRPKRKSIIGQLDSNYRLEKRDENQTRAAPFYL
jgi:hypothetical protein